MTYMFQTNTYIPQYGYICVDACLEFLTRHRLLLLLFISALLMVVQKDGGYVLVPEIDVSTAPDNFEFVCDDVVEASNVELPDPVQKRFFVKCF